MDRFGGLGSVSDQLAGLGGLQQQQMQNMVDWYTNTTTATYTPTITFTTNVTGVPSIVEDGPIEWLKRRVREIEWRG